jgi:bifunctional non-homologous end joining protein LigD
VPLPVFRPLTLTRKPAPFCHPEWLFEIKWDGFRSLARIEHGKGRLISRNGNELKSFPALNSWLLKELSFESAILDGELVCLDDQGRAQFMAVNLQNGLSSA